MAEVVRIALHCEPINPDDDALFLVFVPTAATGIVPGEFNSFMGFVGGDGVSEKLINLDYCVISFQIDFCKLQIKGNELFVFNVFNSNSIYKSR